MKRFLIVSSIIFLGLTASILSGNTFSDDDVNRILHVVPSRNSNTAAEFLVLDKIGFDKKTLTCRIYGSTRTVKIKSSQVKRLPFYENSSAFMITQYALRDMVLKKKISPAWRLARMNRIASQRVMRIEKFRYEEDVLNRQINEFLKNYNLDQDDRIDHVVDVLENSQLISVIKSASAASDWLLAIFLYDKFKSFLKSSLIRRALSAEHKKIIDPFLEKGIAVILSDLQQQMNGPNIRREQFQKIFPKARSIWSGAPPMNYSDLCRLFNASMSSYFKLDSISKVISPQDWGAAVLDVLLLTEGSPDVRDLEKEFDAELRRWTTQSTSVK